MWFQFLLGLLCVSTTISHAQELYGAYVFKGNKSQEGFYFFDSTKFTWFTRNRNHYILGRGIYHVSNNELQLEFTSARKQIEVRSQSESKLFGENTIIRVTAFNEEDQPFEGLEVVLLNSRIHEETGPSGSVELNFLLAEKMDTIRFQHEHVDYLETDISLGGYAHDFIIGITKGIHYKEHQKVHYKFSISGKGLLLISGGRTTKYHLVSLRKYMKLKYPNEKFNP